MQFPNWMVVWGVYSGEFVAFPLFSAPAESLLAATYRPALISRMREAERRTKR